MKTAFLIVLTHFASGWDFQTHDETGATVNAGDGYPDINEAFRQACIFTKALQPEQISHITVVVQPAETKGRTDGT